MTNTKEASERKSSHLTFVVTKEERDRIQRASGLMQAAGKSKIKDGASMSEIARNATLQAADRIIARFS